MKNQTMKKRELKTVCEVLGGIDDDSSSPYILPSQDALTPPTGEYDTMEKENEHAR